MADDPATKVDDLPELAPENVDANTFLYLWKGLLPADQFKMKASHFGLGGNSGGSSGGSPVVPLTGTTHTVAIADAFNVKRCTNAAGCTVTIPPDLALGLGIPIQFDQVGAGQVIFVAGTGVTIQAADGADRTRAQFSNCGIMRVGDNLWTLTGDITGAP